MSDDLDDGIETAEDREAMDWLGRNIFLPMRRQVVRSLLRGNDCQCFSTEQYHVAWKRYRGRDTKSEIAKVVDEFWTLDLARMHLETCGLVREVEPNVWVPTNNEVRR